MRNILKELKLSECQNGLKVGTDAVLLAAFVKDMPKYRALELGAGSGVISLLLCGRRAFSRIDAVEIQSEMADICRENIKNNNFEGKLFAFDGDVKNIEGTEFPACRAVFANPPYMKTGCGKASPHESREISRHEVFGGIFDFSRAAGKVLKTGGKFYTVYRTDRLESLFSALRDNSFAPKRMTFVCSDIFHSPSTVLCEAVKDGSEGLKITPTLFLSENGRESADHKFIYENCKFPERFL